MHLLYALTHQPIGRSRYWRWVPWGIVLALIVLIVWRMIWLSSINDAFNAAFFAGAFLRSIQLGSLYALIAVGYTMVYGIIRLMNFAHGEIFMVGAFVAFFIFTGTPYPLPWAIGMGALVAIGFMHFLNAWRNSLHDPVVWCGALLCFVVTTWGLWSTNLNWCWALVASMFITGVVGMALERVAYKPVRSAPRNSMLITAIAMSIFMKNVGLLAFTKRQTPFRPDTFWTQYTNFDFFGGTVYISWMIVLVPLVTVVLVFVLTLFVKRTRLGKAMRATSQDSEAAKMMGINVDRVIATTFLLGSMLAAAAGVLWGMSYGSINQPAVFGLMPGIKAFAAAVIGGIGSLPGAVIGGMILGFLENFLTALFPRHPGFSGITEYKDAFAFAAMIVILLIRPRGIMGEDLSEKV